MPPHVIDLRKTEDWRDAVHRAVQALVEGRIVAFPTETVYGLAADARNEEAVQRLIEAKGRPEGHPFALAIKGPEEALDYIPDLSPLAARLARRCWPGPVTLVLDARHPESLAGQFPETVRKWLMPSGTLGLRVPAHPMINDVLRMLHGPVVLTSANRSGGSDATTAQQVVESLDGEVHLVLDDGGSRYGQPSSVIRVNGSKLEVLREGVVSSATLTRLSSFVLLFVCTGNTCRSPMAEAIARQVIAEQKGCDPKQLEDHGVIVLSAGVSAMAGGAPSPETVEIMKEYDLDVTDHQAQPVSEQLINHADAIFTLTRSHRAALLAQCPSAAGKVQTLCVDEGDISDPIGGSIEVYRQCAKQIEQAIAERMKQLTIA